MSFSAPRSLPRRDLASPRLSEVRVNRLICSFCGRLTVSFGYRCNATDNRFSSDGTYNRSSDDKIGRHANGYPYVQILVVFSSDYRFREFRSRSNRANLPLVSTAPHGRYFVYAVSPN